jgi:Integrase core domain
MAVNQQFPDGARGQGLSLISDHGCQPTAVAFMEACRTLGLHQTFTSYNNPKGNADTERLMRTLKEEGLWRQEWTCPFALMTALERWIADYNEHCLHSALGYKPPRQFEQEYHASHNPPSPPLDSRGASLKAPCKEKEKREILPLDLRSGLARGISSLSSSMKVFRRRVAFITSSVDALSSPARAYASIDDPSFCDCRGSR